MLVQSLVVSGARRPFLRPPPNSPAPGDGDASALQGVQQQWWARRGAAEHSAPVLPLPPLLLAAP